MDGAVGVQPIALQPDAPVAGEKVIHPDASAPALIDVIMDGQGGENGCSEVTRDWHSYVMLAPIDTTHGVCSENVQLNFARPVEFFPRRDGLFVRAELRGRRAGLREDGEDRKYRQG